MPHNAAKDNGPYVDRMPGLRGVAERKCIELEAELERLREENERMRPVYAAAVDEAERRCTRPT